jgi:hypothetical protein
MRNLSIAIAAITIAVTSGCAKFDLRKKIPWGEGANGRIDEPMRIVAVWTDTVLSQSGKSPKRGFGGRVMFYGENQTEPAKVEGSLVVYAFDETNRDPVNVKPDRKFVFTEAQLEKQYSKTRLGHSYSFWLPWDDVGGPQRQISLICRFVPKKGGVIVSEQTKHLLPGTETISDLVQQPAQGSPQPIGSMQQAGGAPPQSAASGAQQPSGVQHAIGWEPAAGQQSSYPVQQATFEQATAPGMGSPNALIATAGNQNPDKVRRMKSETIATRAIGGTNNKRKNNLADGATEVVAGNVAYQATPNVTQGIGFAPFTSIPQGQASASSLIAQPWMMHASVNPYAQAPAAYGATAAANPPATNAVSQPAAAAQQSPTNATDSQHPTAAQQPSARFSPQPPRALGGPIGRLEPGRDRWQQHHGALPSVPQSQR